MYEVQDSTMMIDSLSSLSYTMRLLKIDLN